MLCSMLQQEIFFYTYIMDYCIGLNGKVGAKFWQLLWIITGPTIFAHLVALVLIEEWISVYNRLRYVIAFIDY